MSRKRPTAESRRTKAAAAVANKATIESWVRDLSEPKTRSLAMTQLLLYQDLLPELPLMMLSLHAPVKGLEQELSSIHPAISPPANPPGPSLDQTRNVCQALSLLKLLALHPQTRLDFVERDVLMLTLPILKSVDKSQPFQQLRQASVDLLEALVRTDQPEVLRYLVDVNIFDSLFSLMDTASDACKAGAVFVLQRLLREERGLRSLCDSQVWLLKAVLSLELLVLKLAAMNPPPPPLLENMLRSYSLLSGDPRGRQCIRQHLPVQMVSGKIRGFLPGDSAGERYYCRLIDNLRTPPQDRA